MACGIASYLAVIIIQAAIQKAVDDINNNRSLLQFGLDITLLLPGFYWTSIFVEAITIIYGAITTGNINDFETALSSADLWQDVRCEIYSAIAASGHVTAANFPTILANLAGSPYPHADVVNAIHDFVQALGFVGLSELSQPAGLAPISDCAECGGGNWCYRWFDGTINSPAWISTPGAGAPPPRFAISPGSIDSVFFIGAVNVIQITQQFPSTMINHFEIDYNVPLDCTSFTFSLAIDGTTISVPSVPGPNTFVYAVPGIAGNHFDIQMNCIKGNDTTKVHISRVLVRGVGVNPFGPSNCV
jgi:hypothetical protein